ncbi:MAG: M23 family metallopeptidase [Candidatus Sericytochromatia bacterium]|uniref:M23 family metallopeptidase n=1 Tax=Candidatus Tanganyikabacteria bacterium TaxID=2961651 RepID=A0A938BNB2_9BACT|nr:M23 family metallopeptidase [Candidatus Tanganyikabacteria bacterium]
MANCDTREFGPERPAAPGTFALSTLRVLIAGLFLASPAGLSACGGSTGPGAVPPLDKARISSAYGMRNHPIKKAPSHHDGYDLAAPAGTPIRAARDGRVTYAGWRGGYGITVEITHVSGLVTRYGHAKSLAVRPGQRVQAGEIIAQVGSTGLSTGPHLHYEVRLYGRPIDARAAGFALIAEPAARKPAAGTRRATTAEKAQGESRKTSG